MSEFLSPLLSCMYGNKAVFDLWFEKAKLLSNELKPFKDVGFINWHGLCGSWQDHLG